MRRLVDSPQGQCRQEVYKVRVDYFARPSVQVLCAPSPSSTPGPFSFSQSLPLVRSVLYSPHFVCPGQEQENGIGIAVHGAQTGALANPFSVQLGWTPLEFNHLLSAKSTSSSMSACAWIGAL